MYITFVDTHYSWKRLLPLTYTRPVADLRVGILKIHEKWAAQLGINASFYRTERYLEGLFLTPTEKSLCILGAWLPTTRSIEAILSLKENQALMLGDQLLAGYFHPDEAFEAGSRSILMIEEAELVRYPWDLFRLNRQEIRRDYALLTRGRKSQPVYDPHTKTYGEQIFLEEGVRLRSVTLNAENGPIYLDKDTEIQEGSVIRGPFALCHDSVVNMGTKIRGDSTIGPYSKVGGEIANIVIQGYSNKGHDGFLGHSVLGEWCNIGADTNNSNLKNNYGMVKMWDYTSKKFRQTHLTFCGLIMGDHAKCGINTMFNTGTTVGVSSNIFGSGYPQTFIPSFSWGATSGFSTFALHKAMETAKIMMARRNRIFTEKDSVVLSSVFEQTAQYRDWEKR